jgi:uncharacterized radical SAM superfamily Fe-S cluster-containing enzyme
MKSMGCMIFGANFRPFILCNDYAKLAPFSAKLVPNEKIIGQMHFVYQLHLRGKRFRQTALHD